MVINRFLFSWVMFIAVFVLPGESRCHPPVTHHCFFVAPWGDDNNSGMFWSPLKTPGKAGERVLPGDTIVLRGGVFSLPNTLTLDFSGEMGNCIHILPFKNEKPVFECVSIRRPGVVLSGNYLHIKGINVTNAYFNGMLVTGSYNLIEQCCFYKNGNTGLHLDKGATGNLILNCDSWLNYDAIRHGEDADGFGVKFNAGPGNIFRGCRAYNNSDDGWDFWESKYSILVENCWAFDNGINFWNDSLFTGNGNGFKLGGRSNVAPHLLYRCLAFCNRFNGFDQNNNLAPQTLINCTAYRNGGTNFRFEKEPVQDHHRFRNNLSFSGWKPGEKDPFVLWGRKVIPGEDDIHAGSEFFTNSWNGFSVSASDFVTTDTTGVRRTRQNDGSLPALLFLHLAPASKLIDGGTRSWYPFQGPAPDLGAFESAKESVLNH